jgi:hypothetical protein
VSRDEPQAIKWRGFVCALSEENARSLDVGRWWREEAWGVW